jgi:hypothetical protein
MAFIPDPINKMRTDSVGTIDTLCGIIVRGDNKERTIPLNFEVHRPYIKHDVIENRTYFVGKKETVVKDGISDVIKDVLSNPETMEVFQGAVCIEFYKEDNMDTAPKFRAIELHTKIYAALKSLPVEISMQSWPTSHMSEYNNYPYAEYIILKPNKTEGMTTLQINFQK